MFKGKKISVVIPTLNEAQGITDTLKNLPDFIDEVIVVDGNSKDQTRELAEKAGAKVILEVRKGYGRAFKTGFEHCTGDIIITGDGDGTYPMELSAEVIQFLMDRQLKFVSCSRLPLKDSTSMRKRNLLGNYALTTAANVLWLCKFSDVLSGMWVFEREVLKTLHLDSDSWNLSEEIKIEAKSKLGKKFGEFAIPYRERLGETKLIPWKVGLQNLGYMFAMRTNTRSILKNFLD